MPFAVDRYARRVSVRLPLRWMVAFALMPALVFQTSLLLGLLNAQQLVAMALAGFLAVGLTRNPALACQLLVMFLHFRLIIMSALYALGVPGGLVRVGGLWKELAVLGLATAVVVSTDRVRAPFDALDRVAIGFVMLGTAYALAPGLLGGAGAQAVSIDDRFVSWRGTVLPVGILLLGRRIPLTVPQVERLFRTVVRVGIVLAVLGVVEIVLSALWNDFFVDVLRVNWFRLEVLGTPRSVLGDLSDIRFVGTAGVVRVVRAGGPMLQSLSFSFALLVAFAVCLERRLRGRPGAAGTWVLVLLFGGVLMSQTRSSILGVGVIALIVLRPHAGHSGRVRAGLSVWVIGVLVLGLVVMLGTGAFQRLVVGSTESDAAHVAGITSGIEVLIDDPLGAGLGMGALGVGIDRSEGQLTTENQFLDIGVQLGVLGMVLFIAVLLLAIRGLRGAAASPDGDPITTAAAGMRLALQGLLIPALFLQPFIATELGWVVFLLVGVALGTGERPWSTPAVPSSARFATRWA